MKPLNREILAIALPAIVSNITTPLLGLIDVAITGHIGSATYIGAIAVGSTMFNMLYWLFGFLRMGTAGITSQNYGAGDFHQSSATLTRGLLMSMTFALVMIVLYKPIGYTALNFLDADDSTAALARLYFAMVIFGAPAVLGMYTLNGWLLGMQNTRLPMWIALLTNVINIVVSASAVFIFGMKIEGIALGTLSAQWIGFITCFTLVWLRYRPEKIKRSELLDRKAVSRLFKINFDIFLRTLCLVAVTAWFTRAGANQGVDILAANAILMQLFMIFSYFSDGFAFAGEALAGKMHGANDRSGLSLLMKSLLRWGIGIALAFTSVYYLFGNIIVNVLTDQASVINTAHQYLPWAILVPVCGIMAFIYDGVAVGLTKTRQMLYSVAIGMGVFFILCVLLLPRLGNHGLWLAFVAYLAIRGVSLRTFLYR